MCAWRQLSEYHHAGARQFGFMLRGLKQLGPKFEALNIPYFLVKGDPIQNIPQLVARTKAALLVTDFAPTELGRKWRDTVPAPARLLCSACASVQDLRMGA